MICDECLKASRDKCEKDISLKPKKECCIAYLEKLKAEFEEDKYILLNQTTAIKVIDNYIEELKGDDKSLN